MAKKARAPKRSGRRPASQPSGRDALLAAALRRFGLHGYHGVSLRTLAQDAGVDSALVARLFGSKAGLWNAMLEDLEQRRVQQFDPRLAALNDRSRAVDARLREMIDVFIEIAAAVPDLVRLLLQDVGEIEPQLADATNRLIGPVRTNMVVLLQEAIDAGRIAGSDADILFVMITSAIAFPFAAPGFVGIGNPDGRDADIGSRLRAALFALLSLDAPAKQKADPGKTRIR